MKASRVALMASWMLAFAEPRGARAEPPRISFERALALAHEHAPMLEVARAREGMARAEAASAGIYPNPVVAVGTSTQTAKLSVDTSVPLVVFGQRGAAMDAGHAEVATVLMETQIAASDVRAACAHAFVSLWLAESTASARADAAVLTTRLESAVRGRVEVGTAPELELLRAHAERLRADSDASAAAQLVSAAAADLARWVGALDGSLRTAGEPQIPRAPASLATLEARVAVSPSVLREDADARAADARVAREQALVRPALLVGLGMDTNDPTLPRTNYRAQLGLEVPVFNQRGPLIERERQAGAAARLRARAEWIARTSDLRMAYQTFSALTARTEAFASGVVPAAEAAARATDDSYALGRATLVTVLDARRASLDAGLSLLEARASRANAWIDVERALGVR